MTNLSDSAKKCLDNYLQQVRACLKNCKTVDADEVEQNIKEHIESELQDSVEPISYHQLNDVLEKLGSPWQWVPEDEIPWWRKVVSRLRTGPEDWRLAYLSFGLLVLSFITGPFGLVIFLPASVLVSRAVLSTAEDSGLMKAQKWLIFPSLIIVYSFLAFWLLAWPIFPLGGLADGMERPRFIGKFAYEWVKLYPWNTKPLALSYWPIAIMFIISLTSLWLFILSLIHQKKPVLLRTIFYPFAGRLKPTFVKWFTRITFALFVFCMGLGIAIVYIGNH